MSNLVSSPKNVVYVNGGQTYNVSAADDVINVNSNLGATEIVLPNIVNQGLDFYPKKFTVNDSGGVAGTNPITISAVGNIVNSGTSFILNRNNVSSEIVIVSKTEYLVNTDNGGSTGVFGSGVAGQLAYFSASTVLGSLTNAQVTVLIDPMVGDSGSGGLKGLVPAPAAGDAAANKYLKADGTWNAISLAGYLKADGTVPLTANWDVGAFEVTAQSLKVDGTAGAGHFHLRYQSTIPTGAANNSKLFSGATGALGWVVDSNAYAFYLDMTGNTASRTLTVPNASGTIALTTDIVNLGNSNLTSTDDARTFTLKSGGTATQNLQILNSAGTVGYYFDGANNLNFGDTTKFVKPTIYLDSTLTDQMHIRRGSNTFFVLNPLGYALNLVGPSGNRIDLYGDGQVYAKGPSAGYFSDNTAGQRIYRQDIQSGTDCYVVMAKGSDNKSVFYAGYGNYLIDNVAIGDTYTFTEKFRVKGAGSTSATTTALFQNSASTNIFKVLDNGNTILNLPSTVAADGDLFNNGVNLYTDGTSLKARYKNNSGTASDLVISSNIYNTSSTITDDARTVTLKSGGTATQNLQFLNSGGGNLLKLSGNKAIDFGSATNTINPKFYLDGDIYQYFSIYNKTNANSICDIFAGASYGNGVFYLKNSLGTANISMNAGIGATPQTAIMNLAGQYSRYRVYNSIGNMVVNLGAGNSDNGDLVFYDYLGTTKVNISTGYSVFDALMKVGGSFALATAQLQVVGGGSTSATTTALFQNSSGNNTLKILDDGNMSNNGCATNSSTNSIVGGSTSSVNNRNSIAWGEGAVANGAYSASFGNSTVSGYGGLAWGNGSNVTGNQGSAAGGSGNTASGLSSFAMGINNTASGTQSTALGLQSVASGLAAMSMGYASTAAADFSGIFAGYNHVVTASAAYSAIIGGTANAINASVLRSVILGGTGITATASDTAYAININATTLITTPQVITTPATITVAANAGTVTRANRINKFTNSSAATMTITMSTTAALDGDLVQVRIYDFSAATQTITWVNTENSSITVPATSNGSTTLPLTVGFQYNSATSKWRCIGSV